MIRRRDLLLGLGAGIAGAAAAEEDFATEIRLGLAPVRDGRPPRLDARALERVLSARLALFPGTGGKVSVRSAEDILVIAPTALVDPGQIKALARVGAFEIHLLEGIRTNVNRDGRYTLEARTVTTTVETTTYRVRDVRTDRLVSLEEFVRDAPLLASSADLAPDGAQPLQDGGGVVLRLTFTDKVTGRLRAVGRKRGRLVVTTLDGAILGLSATVLGKPEKSERKGDRRSEPEPDEFLDLTVGFEGPQEATRLAIVLRSGPLPAPLTVLGTRLTTLEKKPAA